MQKFHLKRLEDETGVSGTGVVAEGVIFSNGSVAMTWLTECSSTAIYKSIFDVEKIHGHQGKTKVVLEDHDVVYESLENKIIYEVGCVNNGWYVRQHDSPMVVGSEDAAKSETEAFEIFLRSIVERFGPSTSRYSPRRLTIRTVPGDKCEQAGFSFEEVRSDIDDHLDFVYRFLINLKTVDSEVMKDFVKKFEIIYDDFTSQNLK
jgi:hypothetical protein